MTKVPLAIEIAANQAISGKHVSGVSRVLLLQIEVREFPTSDHHTQQSGQLMISRCCYILVAESFGYLDFAVSCATFRILIICKELNRRIITLALT